MPKNIKPYLSLAGLIIFLTLPYFVFAINIDSPVDMLRNVGETGAGFAPYEENTFDTIIGTIIKVFLSLLGIIFILLMIYAGYNWMTAGGEEEKVNKAKSTIKHSLVGLLIVVSSYAIWWFIANTLL
jgi:cytochrome bd-type quinol oxidase subunit 2